MILSTTSEVLRVKLGGAVAVNELDMVAAYEDCDARNGERTPGSNNDDTNGTTNVAIVGSPGERTARTIKFLSIYNIDTAAAQVIVQLYDGTNTRVLHKATLQVGEALVYAEGYGFQVLDSTGARKQLDTVTPQVMKLQESVSYDEFTDGGALAGTYTSALSIPAGAVYLACVVDQVVGFTGDTSAALTVGDGTDVDRYNTGTPSVFATAAAGAAMGVPSGTTHHSAAKNPVYTVTSNADFTSVAAGSFRVSHFYLMAA